MGTPLFLGTVEDKEDRVITIRLELFDVENYDRFGTDRVFAWQLLACWMLLPDPPDWYAEAARHVRRVDCDLVAGKVVARGSNWVTAGPDRGEPEPAMSYEIELYDASIVDGISIGDEEDLAMYVVEGPPLRNEEAAS